MVEIRPAAARGRPQYGWLDSWHSFSFGDYRDPARDAFGPLRVLNDDRIAPATGFGMHGHAAMEIITLVLDGVLTHRDSLGHQAVIVPGEVQCMSAGTGIRHSELNAAPDQPLHLLQIWIQPSRLGTPPHYDQKVFAPAERQGRLQAVVAPDGVQGALPILQDAWIYLGDFAGGQAATLPLRPGRRAYVHLARGELRVNGITMQVGDALALTAEVELCFDVGRAAEVVVFDLP